MKYIHLLSLLLLCISCNKEPIKYPSRYNTYASGNQLIDSITTKAVMWANDTTIILSEQNSEAFSIALSGKDVYVAGVIHEGSRTRPVYWKNAQIHYLPDEGKNYKALNITIDQNNIYVWGRSINDFAFNIETIYWKNDILTKIPTIQDSLQVTDVQFEHGDLYYMGVEIHNHKEVNVYHKNNNRIVMDGDGDHSQTWGNMHIVNGEVYIAGIEYYPDPNNNDMVSNNTSIILWKNGFRNYIQYGPDAFTASITFDNGNYFITSMANDTDPYGACWRNGTRFPYKYDLNLNPVGIRAINDHIYTFGTYRSINKPGFIAAYYDGAEIHLLGKDFTRSSINDLILQAK